MASQFNFEVDTKPMAAEIDKVSSHVQGTTAAVAAFQTAVIAAEVAGANRVCKNVNSGFHALMLSNISQKIASAKSRVDALYMELNAQKKRLLNKRNELQANYERTTDRYVRIFTGLNKSLKQRVYNLDKPIFDLVERDAACDNNRNLLLAAIAPISQTECISASQQILASNLKNDSVKVISATEEFLRQNNEQKAITNKILLGSVSSQQGTDYLPVVVYETQLDKSGNTSYNLTIPQDLSTSSGNAIKSTVFENVSSLQWSENQLNELTSQEFNRMVSQTNVSQRVKDTMQKLFNAAETKTF